MHALETIFDRLYRIMISHSLLLDVDAFRGIAVTTRSVWTVSNLNTSSNTIAIERADFPPQSVYFREAAVSIH